MAVAPAAERALLAAAAAQSGDVFDIDCTDLTFIDSSGIAMLIDVARRSGKDVNLVNVERVPRRAFEVLGLCEMFGIPRKRVHLRLVSMGND
jgi:anti-anti-sigma factor